MQLWRVVSNWKRAPPGTLSTYLELVDGWDNFARRVAKKLLEVAYLKVGDANVPHLARVEQLLHLLPVGHAELSATTQIR